YEGVRCRTAQRSRRFAEVHRIPVDRRPAWTEVAADAWCSADTVDESVVRRSAGVAADPRPLRSPGGRTPVSTVPIDTGDLGRRTAADTTRPPLPVPV